MAENKLVSLGLVHPDVTGVMGPLLIIAPFGAHLAREREGFSGKIRGKWEAPYGVFGVQFLASDLCMPFPFPGCKNPRGDESASWEWTCIENNVFNPY